MVSEFHPKNARTILTSPNRTSWRANDSPVEHTNEIVFPVVVGIVGISGCRQTPDASAVAVIVLPPVVVLTMVPVGANPHTVAAVGARCNTMWSPNTLLSVQLLVALAMAAMANRSRGESIIMGLRSNMVDGWGGREMQ